MMIKEFGKAIKTSIDNFQNHIGFKLPDDYITFLMEHNGGIFIETRLLVPLLGEVLLHILYGIVIDSDFDLKSWNDEYKDDLLPNSIIIGHDYSGAGFIVLIAGSENEGIYYWDHTFTFEQSNEEHNTYFIADSFQEFIDKLL